MADARTREINFQVAILELMKDGRAWENDELKQFIPSKINLTNADKEIKKRGEPVWMQSVNNCLAQSQDRPNSLYSKQFVENCGHGMHRITKRGIDWINS